MRRKKYGLRIATIALGLAMALGMNVSKVYAAPGNEQVQQKELTNYGLTADYTISNTEEMDEFAKRVANGNSFEGKIVVLTNNIVYNGNVNKNFPIEGFGGIFDGQGHSISGLNVSSDSRKYAGLFGYVYSKCVIQNLIVKNSIFKVSDDYYDTYAGGICGENHGKLINCGVLDSTIIANFVGQRSYTSCNSGSICGRNNGVVRNCFSLNNSVASARSGGDESIAGGICGYNENGIIVNSCTTSMVTADDYIGGIVGYSTGSGYVRNCYNVGSVTTSGRNSRAYVGGIAGYSKADIYYCYTSKEAATDRYPYMSGDEDGNERLDASQMATVTFLDKMNNDLSCSAEWTPWEFRSESIYPLPKKAINISDCTFSVAGNCVYNGEEQKPGVFVSYNGTTLTQGVHYSATYSDNKNAGTGTVTITGIGIYSGTEKISFTINKAPHKFKYKKSYTKEYKSYSYGRSFKLDAECIQGNGGVTYSSSNKKIATVDSYGNVEYHKVGKATITIKAEETDNYAATQISITLTVKPQKQTIVSSYVSSGKMKIKWVKDTQASGYELQYARDKKFTKSLKTVKIKKNKTIKYTSKKLTKKKTYYVRVRSYKGNIYGAWSKVVKVKRNK